MTKLERILLSIVFIISGMLVIADGIPNEKTLRIVAGAVIILIGIYWLLPRKHSYP